MSNVYFPAVGFLLALLPEEKTKFLKSVETSGRLLSNFECYQYFSREWNLPPMSEDDDSELAGARIIADATRRVEERFRHLLNPSIVELPAEFKDE